MMGIEDGAASTIDCTRAAGGVVLEEASVWLPTDEAIMMCCGCEREDNLWFCSPCNWREANLVIS